MPEITVERWQELYERAFAQVYRALVAATLDRDRALDGLHDAFEEGMRHLPSDDRNLEGWLYRVALRKTKRGLFSHGPRDGHDGACGRPSATAVSALRSASSSLS